MLTIRYVFPNISGIVQRGGLLKRWTLADEVGCAYIEVPADLIKNATEVAKTKLDLCSFIPPTSIPLLYEHDLCIPSGLKYILHTEPSLPRQDGHGISAQAPLRWYDPAWVKCFVDMVISICAFFNKPASVIEIHPGDSRNTFQNLGDGISKLQEAFKEQFKAEPLVMLENRTGQFIATGEHIAAFWAYLIKNHNDLVANIGIVLDIQQLYTCTNDDFIRQLHHIPSESIRGFHIHRKHRSPRNGDGLPWNIAFEKIAQIDGEVLINPEVHHKKDVGVTIDFCKEMLTISK